MNIDFGDVFEDEPFAEERKMEKFEYQYIQENPYLNQNELMKLAEEMNSNLELVEAVKVLEAEVQKNPNNCKAWRLLGTLH